VTIGEAMVRVYLTYLGVFGAWTVLILSVGVLVGCWIGADWQRRRQESRRERPVLAESPTVPIAGDAWLEPVLDEPAFTPGVAKVGEQ
jgi:hypothetical protein